MRAGARALRVVSAYRRRVLDPVDRFAEVIFGLVMVLAFTGSMSVAQGGQKQVREMLVAAFTCNVAWGLVDGVMYVIAAVVLRARVAVIFEGIRDATPETARAIALGALPEGFALFTDEAEVDRIVQRIRAMPAPLRPGLHARDLLGALASAVLVVLATFPPTIPFLLLQDPVKAIRISNLVAVASLFLAGWSLGKATGVRPGILGLTMVVVGTALVLLTVALGG